MNNYIEVANRIKSCAKSRGITQAHLCETIGKRRTFISEVVAGKDNIDEEEIQKIADALGVSPDYLIGETDDPTPTGSPIELSSAEKEMLELYRSVSPEKQELFRNIIEQMKG